MTCSISSFLLTNVKSASYPIAANTEEERMKPTANTNVNMTDSNQKRSFDFFVKSVFFSKYTRPATALIAKIASPIITVITCTVNQ